MISHLRFLVFFIIIFYFSYRVFSLTKDSALFGPLRFLIVLFISAGLSNLAGFHELSLFWKFLVFSYAAAVAVIFQPELRRIYFNRTYHSSPGVGGHYIGNEEIRGKFIDDVVLACQTLSRKKIGALIVLERKNNLWDFIQTGILIDALFSPELAYSVFLLESPLHDGAVIVRENRIVAAGCILPLAERVEMKKLVGTRHRAAVGITEQADGLSIVVSEETGKVSLAVQGRIAWDIEAGALKKMIRILYREVDR
ncbi:MAG TPA: diadenylate cyclase CdaA [Atribacteraceae bacterium]|nr:diadenylate cyclase CdaA [Atribacteraceae bacterium]